MGTKGLILAFVVLLSLVVGVAAGFIFIANGAGIVGGTAIFISSWVWGWLFGPLVAKVIYNHFQGIPTRHPYDILDD